MMTPRATPYLELYDDVLVPRAPTHNEIVVLVHYDPVGERGWEGTRGEQEGEQQGEEGDHGGEEGRPGGEKGNLFKVFPNTIF